MVYTGETVEERMRLDFKCQQSKRLDDSGHSKMIVVVRAQPHFRALAKVCGWFDLHSKTGAGNFHSVEFKHSREGRSQVFLKVRP